MTALATISEQLQQTMREWRRHIHAHPETAFEEYRTSKMVAELLTEFGLKVHTGIAGTGVVAELEGDAKGEPTNKIIGLRADMDALHVHELNTFAHRSTCDGKMHACGHDGHTAMLLGAAAHLSQHRQFNGKVVFIFQPAEEGEAGAKAMCDAGLFDKYPVDAVFGMHNWPELPAGQFAVHERAVMASMDLFDITITGKGCHAGMPHLGVDPVVVAGQLITSLQSIVGRTLNSLDSGVVSITKMQGGETYNVIPDSVTLSGTCRTFSPDVQASLASRIRQQVHHICSAYGAEGELDYRKVYPPTINTPSHAALCSQVASLLVGEQNVKRDKPPSMGAEDFAFMLNEKPGAYIWLGNCDDNTPNGLHNPHYDFNDDMLGLGAQYWVNLVHAFFNNSASTCDAD